LENKRVEQVLPGTSSKKKKRFTTELDVMVQTSNPSTSEARLGYIARPYLKKKLTLLLYNLKFSSFFCFSR
jgi:hypothetical protein